MINHNAEEYSVFVIVFELNSFTKVVFVFFFVVDIWIVFIWRARYQLPILTVIFNNSGIYSGFDKEVKYLLESTRFAIFDGDHDSPDYEGEYEDNDNGFHRDRSTMKLWATMSLVSPLQQLLSSRRCSRWKKFKIPWDNKWPWNHGYRLCCSNLKTSVSLEYMYKFALLCTNIIFNVTKRTFMFKTVGAIWTARWNGRFDWGSGKFSGRGADKPTNFYSR